MDGGQLTRKLINNVRMSEIQKNGVINLRHWCLDRNQETLKIIALEAESEFFIFCGKYEATKKLEMDKRTEECIKVRCTRARKRLGKQFIFNLSSN